jgi:hypothetical protein
MILILLSSILLALAATWTIRACLRCPDRLLLFSVFACSGIALSFEALSFLSQLQIAAIRVAIGASVLVTLAGVRSMSWSIAGNDRNDDWTPTESWTGGWRLLGTSSKDPARFLEAGVSILLFLILTATAFIALSSVPNNSDSMSYHLPRIEHWLQNKNLSYYPTSIIRQLDSNPFAEELILALRSIIDLYPLANMVQWMSFAGCIMVTGQICRQLGGSRQSQSLAHALAATLPMGILQASSTQNDLVVAFFSATCVYFVLRVQKIYSLVFPAILAGVLAFHTKGTAAIFIFGFVVVYGAQILLRRPPINFWRNSIIACLLAAGIVGGYFSRNLHQFGALTGPFSNATLTREPNWRSMTLNAVRDVAINLYFPKAASIRSDIVDLVSWTQRHLDISQAEDDDRYTFSSERFVLPYPLHEDFGSNTIHTLIIMGAAAIALYLALSSRKGSRQFASLSSYLLATVLSMSAFFILIRWQPWIVRLQLGGFMILIPPVALLLSKIMSPKFLVFLLAVLSIQSYEFAFKNLSRPIFGNWSVATASAEDVLFANQAGLKADYLRLVDQLAQARPKRVGLFIGGDSWEFPIWYMLRQKLPDQEMPAIVHETDENTSDPAAEFLIVIDRTAPTSVVEKMTPIAGFDKIHLYRRVQPPPPQ